jgi:hypothetical protein
MTYVVYESTTGRILKSGTCPPSMLGIKAKEGETALAGDGLDSTHYVDISADVPALTKKSEIPGFDRTVVAADGVDAATITGLPNPTFVTLSTGAGASVEDGTLALTFDTPGDYTVDLDAGIKFVRTRTVIHAA